MLTVLGGLGLFLLGMIVLTEGLRGLAGNALRRTLAQFTKSPLSGAVTGSVTTAVLQSSSATTVAAVGFVAAGLLTFPQALGIIFGANLGTTATGWIVAVLGFKLELGTLALPIVFVGAIARLFGGLRVGTAGFALAGFGLIFGGIDALQQGMEGLRDVVTPQSFPDDTLLGRALLVLIGMGITVVTQSSSAGVATALAALHVGTISLPQAAAMVIGMDVGTTCTAALATLGGATDARRTGFAHVIYNVLTGVAAFLSLPLFVHLAGPHLQGEFALVAFHTSFNLAGVLLVLPFTKQFASLVERIVPHRETPFSARLDTNLLRDTDAAIQALTVVLGDIAAKAVACWVELVDGTVDALADRLALLSLAIDETRAYVERMTTSSEQGTTFQRHLSAMHAIDHIDRLIERCAEPGRAETIRGDPELASLAAPLVELCEAIRAPLGSSDREPEEAQPESVWRAIDAAAEPFRHSTLHAAVSGRYDSREADARLDAMRWLQRIAYHNWRIVHHLRRCHFDSELRLEEAVPRREELL